jgi:C-terminal processing protease CtpA/Prc
MKKSLFLAAALCLLLQACGGGGGGAASTPSDPQSASCTTDAERSSLLSWMDDRYYWYADMNPADLASTDMNGFFTSMLAKPIDRYSFTQTTASFDQVFTSGWRVGYGYTLVQDSASSSLRVRNVEPASPVDVAGMRRGDTVLSIDGHTPAEILAGAVGPVTVGSVPRTFVLKDIAGNQRTITVNSGVYTVAPVATWSTLDATRNGQPVKVGYMVYNQFTQYSTWDFALVTQNMAAQGVQEMVLDLRYNGGGAVVTSRDLASMISGSQTDGAVFARLKYNDKHPELTQDIPFMTASDRFTQPIEGLKRLVVITSGGTASASELLINGLRPFMQVVLVGDTTYGKPYGFNPRSDCGTTYNAMNFEAVNSLGVGGYSNGIPADCPASDDLDHQLGDTQERRLKEALNYIATGSCSAQAPQSASIVKKAPPRTFGDTVPPQMFY